MSAHRKDYKFISKYLSCFCKLFNLFVYRLLGPWITDLIVVCESEPELEAAEGCSVVGEGRDTVRAGGCRSSWVPVAPESSNSGRFGKSHADAAPNSLRSLASLALEDLRLLARLPLWTCRRADSLPPHPLPALPSLPIPPGLEVCVCESTSWAILSRSFFILLAE